MSSFSKQGSSSSPLDADYEAVGNIGCGFVFLAALVGLVLAWNQLMSGFEESNTTTHLTIVIKDASGITSLLSELDEMLKNKELQQEDYLELVKILKVDTRVQIGQHSPTTIAF